MARKTASGASRISALLLGGTLTFAIANLGAQQGTPPAGPPPAQAPAGARSRGAPPVMPYDDYTGFTKLWDGATFTNWDGESDVWTIEDGTLHADTTKTPGQHHIHYIGPGAVMKDFDLKVEFKISASGANGGIQYRSRLLHVAHGGSIQDPLGKNLPANIKTMNQAIAAGLTSNPQAAGAGGNRGGATPPAGAAALNPAAVQSRCSTGGGPPPTAGPSIPSATGNPWQVSGYQFDLDSGNGYTGQLYEGQGRSIVTAPGAISVLLPGRQSACLGIITDNPASLVKPHLGKDGNWNQVEIIARGNTLVHLINGHVISVTIDDNPDFRAFQGILSLQLEGTGQIWYRNVYVKPLEPAMVFPEVKR